MIKPNLHSLSVLVCVLSLFSMTETALAGDKLAAQAGLPSDSIYHLKIDLENQSREFVDLDLYKGQPVLVAMFYASCPYVCPMLINTIKQTEAKLSPHQRAELRVLAISIDPVQDTPQVLLDTVTRHKIDTQRWSMVRTKEDEVRTVAATLGIKYKQLPSGEFSHSTKILLYDANGSPIASTSKIDGIYTEFLTEIRNALQ